MSNIIITISRECGTGGREIACRLGEKLGLRVYDKAILDYSEIIKKDPSDIDALNRRAFAYYEMRDYDKARTDYEAVLKINPTDYLSALGIVLVLQKTNKVSEAVTRIGFLIAAYPDLPGTAAVMLIYDDHGTLRTYTTPAFEKLIIQ